jgi:hypothetical protein
LLVAVALEARVAGVDHVADARHGERSLGDVGGKDDAALLAGLEDAVLLGRGEAPVQGQNFGLGETPAPQSVQRIADLALARQEHQHVAGPFAAQLVDRIGERLLLLVARGVFRVAAHRPVAHFHRVEPARDLDHRCVVEVLRETPGVDGGRGDDDFQLWA